MLSGQVIQVQPNGNFVPYGGTEVCVLDSMPPVCSTADASGMLVIVMPTNSRTGLTMSLPGKSRRHARIEHHAADRRT
jgi:hypothetical protein